MLVKNRILLFLLALCATMALTAGAPKREFRGAWLHTVYQSQYKNMGTEKCKAYLRSQLDSLKAMGVNAVLFQVRPQSDALLCEQT